MRQLSIWASAHRAAARYIIIGAFLLLNALSILLAVFLFDDQARGAAWLMGAFIIIMPAAAIAYPDKDTVGRYWRRKACEGGVVLATFLLVLGNTAIELQSGHNNAITQYANASYRAPQPAQAHGLYEQLHQLRDGFQEMSTAAKIILCILVAAVAALAGTLIVFAACELACAGNGALASLVAIVGLGGIIAGGYLLIRRIFRGPRWFQKKLAPTRQGDE